MNAEEFIRLAGRLAASTADDPAAFRTSVSRAYYGVFHLARQLLDELGIRPSRSDNSHLYLQHFLHGSAQPNAMLAGALLGQMHSNRLRADYELDDKDVGRRDVARYSVEVAHQLISLINACRQEPIRTEIVAGIPRYQQARKGGPA
jgi:uncharacterized protein (UPF0332 family)